MSFFENMLMELKQNLPLLNILEKNILYYIPGLKTSQLFLDRDNNLKICLQPGSRDLRALKFEKHWILGY